MREFIINIVLICFTFQRVFSKNPHIIFILADDLGWNDVGFHGSNQIPTPNIDALAYTGIILNNYYVTPICTPSRSALLTGKYPIHLGGLQHGVIHGSTPYGLSLKETILPQHLKIAGYATRLVGKWHLGMQHRVIYESEPWGLGLDDIILPQYLKKVGYATSIVGKWHLGHFKKLYLPDSRGFDSHYGYWTGRQDYYDHTAVGKHGYKGYDMRRGMNVTWSDNNTYTTDLLTNEAVKIIKNHPREKPLFLYISHLATHSGNPDRPLQAPQDIIDKFKYISDKKRRIFAAMLWKMDESIGLVVSALAKSKMLDNSVIVFSTDNGGPADGFNFNAASNWPLRGVKDTLWEGGVRGAGFVWCPFLPSSVVSNAMIHITDWLPTLLSLTTYPGTIDGIDGVNVWDSLDKSNPSPRDEILLNIDNERNVSALRYKNWKYKKGNTGTWNHWYGPSGRNSTYNWAELYNCKVTKAIKHLRKLPKKASINQIRSAATVVCNEQPKEETGIALDNLSSSIYLYDLNTDPCEMRNLVSKQPNVVQLMEHKLKTYQETTVPPRNKPSDPRSNPIYWNNTWTNWMDYL